MKDNSLLTDREAEILDQALKCKDGKYLWADARSSVYATVRSLCYRGYLTRIAEDCIGTFWAATTLAKTAVLSRQSATGERARLIEAIMRRHAQGGGIGMIANSDLPSLADSLKGCTEAALRAAEFQLKQNGVI